MHYKVLFRIEKFDLIEKLKQKIVNFKKYFDETKDTYEIEVVFAGDVVQYFKGEDDFFVNSDIKVKLCKNALTGSNMPIINFENIETVLAGIGEIIKRKSEGWIEYTIE